jgi:copper chaperone CopZ
MERFHATVEGMTCDHCVRAVTTEVEAVPGVERALVDLSTGHLEVESSEPVEPAAIEAAVREAGYQLAPAS